MVDSGSGDKTVNREHGLLKFAARTENERHILSICLQTMIV
jgi:hypothetical protein